MKTKTAYGRKALIERVAQRLVILNLQKERVFTALVDAKKSANISDMHLILGRWTFHFHESDGKWHAFEGRVRRSHSAQLNEVIADVLIMDPRSKLEDLQWEAPSIVRRSDVVARRKSPVISEEEYDRLVKMCSLVATDARRMFDAVERLLESVNSADREWLKARLGLVKIENDGTDPDRGVPPFAGGQLD